jgi:valyl-tRNA synthetase
MQPHLAKKIEQATRKQFPDGIQSFGTDALRFTFASLASTGRDIRFDLQRTEGYRNFCNKLWNAARYVLMNTEDQDNGVDCAECTYSQADLWILSRLNRTIANTTDAINSYRFDLAAQAIYEFTWNEYCDWYLELAKISLQSDDVTLQRGTRQTLLKVLEIVLRLAHPIMPFITEEIWQRVGPLAGVTAATIMLQPYPESDAAAINVDAETKVQWTMDFILGIRRIRGEMNIAPGKPLNVLLQNGSVTDQSCLKDSESYLLKLGRLESITWLKAGENAPESAIALVGDMKILIPMAGLIDKEAELARLTKEIQRIENELPRIEGKLSNAAFVDKAPPEVIAKEREKLAGLKSALNNLNEQQAKIKAL